jgi:Predicted transcriptional regulator
MSGALIESTTILPRSHRRTRGHRPSSAQTVTKKMPQSETQTPVIANGSSDLLDVAFIRLPEVKAVTGLSKTTIYELIRVKDFPAPVRLGPRVVAWVKSEVRQWAVGRVQASRSAA